VSSLEDEARRRIGLPIGASLTQDELNRLAVEKSHLLKERAEAKRSVDQRRRLLARMAGNIAAGVVPAAMMSGNNVVTVKEAAAEAVAIAEAILQLLEEKYL
jgi:hypothetical protein